MCGIAGSYGFAPNPRMLRRMGLAQAHRGPDGHAIFTAPGVGLSHQRLAVIDIEGGRQPMTTQDGRFTLVYNGEVYNYQQLRRELAAGGASFTTASDTEVVLAAYATWGTAAFERFNGMFALAVWDAQRQQLTLARDHFGIKPLYVTRLTSTPTVRDAPAASAGPDAGGVVGTDSWLFASEIKSLLATGLVTAAPDDAVIYRYLRHRVHDDGRATFFAGIERLLPGETMTLSSEGMNRSLYTRLREELSATAQNPRPYDEAAVAGFRDRLRESVRLRLRADVPVGTSLSGGLDSSAVVATIDDLRTQPTETSSPRTRPDTGAGAAEGTQNTFSAVFPGCANDEEQYVDDVLDGCHGRITAHKIRPRSTDLIIDLDDFIRTQEEPVVSTGPYAQYQVMREASRHVTVLLDGQGADELLGGYTPHLLVHARALLAEDTLAGARESLAAHDVLRTLIRQKAHSVTRPQHEPILPLLNHTFVAAHAKEQYTVPNGTLRERLVHDLYVGSLPALLRYEDKNSMRFSVEGRVPFLDPDLVRYTFALEDRAVIHAGWNKRILREATSDLLPSSITRRRNKIGFTTPQSQWFTEQREPIFRIMLSDTFANRPYFNRNEVITAFEAWLHGAGRLDSLAFWRILNVELWLRAFIDAPAHPRSSPQMAAPPAPGPSHDTPAPSAALDPAADAEPDAGPDTRRVGATTCTSASTPPATALRCDRHDGDNDGDNDGDTRLVGAAGADQVGTEPEDRSILRSRYGPNPGKALDLPLPHGGTVRRYPLRTSPIRAEDDLLAAVAGHVGGFVRTLNSVPPSATGRQNRRPDTTCPWYLFVSEKVVALTQHRSRFLWEIPVSRPARFLARHVTRTPAGIGLGSPFTMQLAIDEVGLPRILLAAAGGALGKALGRHGLFYTLAGSDVRAIDGPTAHSVYPANMSAKLAPATPRKVAAVLSQTVRAAVTEPYRTSFRGTVIIDANDLGQVILGTDVPGSTTRLADMFGDNPLGQGRELTPMAAVFDLTALGDLPAVATQSP